MLRRLNLITSQASSLFASSSAATHIRQQQQSRRSLATTDYNHYKERINHGVGRSHNILMDRAEGSYMYDVSGRKYLDFACGIGVTNLGHCHPRLVKVVQNQAGKLWHGMVAHGIHTAMAELIDEMETITPKVLDNLFFCSSGAEAIEGAIRCARNVTKRPNIMVMQGSFHGRTNACLALTTSKYVYALGSRPLMSGVHAAPIPFTTQLKMDPNASVEAMTHQCLGVMEDLLFQTQHPSEVAMILVEPVLGEGGYLPLPAAYLRGLRALCDKHGIMLCFDEVQSGYGRTGTMWATEQIENIVPDILCFAKGVANGLPLAGFITQKKHGDLCPAGTQGGTYAGNAVACASAAEVIRIFREEKILDNVVEQGKYLFAALESMIVKNNFPIQEVRGRGLMIGFQFTDDAPAGISGAVVSEALNNNLMLLNTSKFETIRLIPALNVTRAQCDEAMAILEKSISSALAAKGWDASKKKVVAASSASSSPSFRNCCESSSGAACPCYKMANWDIACRRITQFEQGERGRGWEGKNLSPPNSIQSE